MKTNETKIDNDKVDKFFYQQVEMFINNSNKDGLNFLETCCAATRLFIVTYASLELFDEGITDPTEEQTANKCNEICTKLRKIFTDAVK